MYLYIGTVVHNSLIITRSIWIVYLQAFAEEYSKELQLNASFNHFATAYEKAYNGPNTLQHQLGVKNKYIRDESEWCKLQLWMITKAALTNLLQGS